MITCPRCKHRFIENTSSQQAFELFHALRDEYAKAQGMNMVTAKDTLCVMFGVSLEYGDDFNPPKWPGVFCELWDRRFFRKSTLAYTPKEMAHLIESTEEAIHVREEA